MYIIERKFIRIIQNFVVVVVIYHREDNTQQQKQQKIYQKLSSNRHCHSAFQIHTPNTNQILI